MMPTSHHRRDPRLAEAPQFFYVILADPLGGKLAVRCHVGARLPMEPDPDGVGTYIFFPDMMLLVKESEDEINELILRKLAQLQEAWTAEGGVDPAGFFQAP